MTLRNTEFRITFRSKSGRFYYYFAKDAGGWYQITAAGNRHKATAEQVLNHVLPALAEVAPGARLKPGVNISVKYVPESSQPGEEMDLGNGRTLLDTALVWTAASSASTARSC